MKSQFSLKNNQQDRGTEVGKVYFEKSLDYDVYNDMKNYDGKVLIVHGTSDNIAPISYSRGAIETFKDAKLKEIEFYKNSKNHQLMLPYIGFNYQEHRVLLVAESHYLKNEEDRKKVDNFEK